ncbi:hypothetical protein [Silvanigrella aquatica]|uniref:Lipoprotein n=1 Tax=Silvanigrella aquatica TaxID=1915309 RepID=A0A1L4CXJ1_9BACT|nr:hypothetical protein [Silvanigrella aquatica]APJ02672.1 hypothetical protein AXG55_01490 [Silvanigrella aquatica]
MKNTLCYRFTTIILPFILLTQSCIVTSHRERVLEQSQKETPAWVKENEQDNMDKNSVSLIYKKSGIYNLNLGLKQAQTAAVIQTSYLIMSKIQKTLLKNLPTPSNNANKERDSLLNELSQVVSQSRLAIGKQPALPKDIYWEYLEKDTDNGSERFYTIWVLLSVPKVDYESALTTTALSLSKSENSDIAGLGQSILQQITPH